MLGGLCALNPKLNTNEQQHELKIIDQTYLTVKENSKYVSNRQLKKAQDVKSVQSALAMPSVIGRCKS